MTKRDYYDVLGINKSASPEQIKSAYRKLAVKYHPDKNKGDKASEEKFKEASEAYHVLSNTERKQNYDNFGHAAFENGGGGRGGFGNFDFSSHFSDIFEDFFGEGFGGGRRTRKSNNRGSDLRYDLSMSINEVYSGKKQDIKLDDLVSIKPITDNQKVVFEAWRKQNKNLFLFGAAGTGKTFISLYLALEQVLDPKTKYQNVIIIRSVVPTRDIGFLPGDEEDKSALYQVPYHNMVQFMFEQSSDTAFSMLYDRLKNQNSVTFLTTSYLRGITLDNAIVIVDESQNCNFHELDTIVTRVGQDSKIIFCGDFFQSDLTKMAEKEGLQDFMRILENMKEFEVVEFTIGDIVRSGFVRSYLIEKTKLGLEE